MSMKIAGSGTVAHPTEKLIDLLIAKYSILGFCETINREVLTQELKNLKFEIMSCKEGLKQESAHRASWQEKYGTLLKAKIDLEQVFIHIISNLINANDEEEFAGAIKEAKKKIY